MPAWHMHRTKVALYSITPSAMANRDCGAVRPSDFAVLRLMTISNFIGAMKIEQSDIAKPRADHDYRRRSSFCCLQNDFYWQKCRFLEFSAQIFLGGNKL
jgi:hypothetical protein